MTELVVFIAVCVRLGYAAFDRRRRVLRRNVQQQPHVRRLGKQPRPVLFIVDVDPGGISERDPVGLSERRQVDVLFLAVLGADSEIDRRRVVSRVLFTVSDALVFDNDLVCLVDLRAQRQRIDVAVQRAAGIGERSALFGIRYGRDRFRRLRNAVDADRTNVAPGRIAVQSHVPKSVRTGSVAAERPLRGADTDRQRIAVALHVDVGRAELPVLVADRLCVVLIQCRFGGVVGRRIYAHTVQASPCIICATLSFTSSACSQVAAYQ